MSSQDSINLPSRADYLQQLQQQQSSPTLQGECGICCESTSDPLVSACGHLLHGYPTHDFHHECLLAWLSETDGLDRYKRTCPTCRRELYSQIPRIDSNWTARNEELQQAIDERNNRRMRDYSDLAQRRDGERLYLLRRQTQERREQLQRQDQALEELNQRQEVYESRLRYLNERLQLIEQYLQEYRELLQRQDQALREFDRHSISEIDSLYESYEQDMNSLLQSYDQEV